MKLWKKLPEIFLSSFLDKTPDLFEKARIRLAFYLSLAGILFIIPLSIALFLAGLFFSFAIALSIDLGLIMSLYVLKYKENLKLCALIVSFSIFTGMTLDMLLSNTNGLVDIIWFINLIIFSFFTLGQLWGLTFLGCSLIVNYIYIQYFFYENFHDENIYSSGQILALLLSVLLGYIMIYYMIKETMDAQGEAEKKLKENFISLQSLNEKLNVSNKSLESFTYSVSHDLRAPLRAINGFNDILTKRLSKNIDKDSRELFGYIAENGKKMNLLIDELLAFSRSGTRQLSLVTADMNVLVNESIIEYEKNEEKIRASIMIDLLPSSAGDVVLLKQVLYNLISNAIKYSSKNDNPIIKIGAIKGKEQNTYYVKDNGVGFDMKYASKLFGVFQRLHDDSEFKGTGIGLAIVKQIIERHGGKVWAEGKLNEGATFYFSLPKSRSDFIPKVKSEAFDQT